MSPHAVLFVTYIIAGFNSLKYLGTCSEILRQNDSQDDLSINASSSDKNEGVFYLKHSIFLKNSSTGIFEKFLNIEPVISDPLFEDNSWNSSFKEMNKKRDVPEKGLSHDLKMKILQLHNLYRSNVTPPAGNMAYMEWDEDLAKLAQMWTDGCVFDHGMPDNDYPETIGQNLYIGTDPTGYLGLWMWYEEYHNYDLRKQYCLPNKQCGHYVQMAWAASNRLGCGMTKCNMRYFIACHYSPQALKGVQMYTVAKPCSQCSSKNGALCLENLCVNWEQCKQNPFDCKFARCELECLNCGKLNKEKCSCECADGWDSPDCSHLCMDKHERCGKSPGWPTKSACSLNRNAVAETFCRKMCEMCNPLDDKSKNVCCDGSVCEEGFVLNTKDKSCKCTMLCPGPICDDNQEGEVLQASLQGSAPRLTVIPYFTLWIVALWFYKVFVKEVA